MKKSFKLLSVIALTAIIAFAGLNCGGGGGGSSDPEITMKTEASYSAFYIVGSGSITIDWGDGAAEDGSLDSNSNYYHDYISEAPRTIRISGTENIAYFECTGVELTSLKLSGCTALEYLSCNYNNLTSLNVSGSTALNELDCSDNELTSLNVSGCTALTYLDCYDNKLNKTALDTLFNDLPIRPSNDGEIYIGENPGAAGEPYSNQKGWTVYYD